MFSFGYFPGVRVLKADVSEPSIGSIFKGRWVKNDYIRNGCGTTISGINTPHISALVILHPPALEDGTGRGFRNVGF